MKLLNHTLKYLVILLPIIIGVWAALFYYNMVDEVEDSLDDGLENYKMLIIEQALGDTTILQNDQFNERNYAIRPLKPATALTATDVYLDTLMYMIAEDDFEPVRMLKTAFRQQDRYYELRVISSSLEKDDLIEDLLYAIVILYIALLLSVLWINNFVLRKIWTPFYQLLGKIGKFNLERNPVLSPTPSNVKEFQELDDRIVALARHAAATYESQKQFLENAAHELQTPLAISINQLELLAEQPGGDAFRLEAISGVIRNLQRLTRLNKALLLLTKIENRQYGGTEAVDVHSLVTRQLEQFEDLAASKQLTVDLENRGALHWNMHPDLAVILVANLLKNALVHTPIGGQIRVLVAEDEFRISNTAVSSALDGQRIFDRFHKNSSDNQRIGLGLAIVKAISEVSGLRTAYQYEAQAHHFFVTVDR